MTEKYILNEQGNPVVERDLMKWAKWFEVAGLDHSFGGGPPILFKTMIFGGTHVDYQGHYENRVAALAGHDQAMPLVQDD